MTPEIKLPQNFEDLYSAGKLAMVANVTPTSDGKVEVVLDLGSQDPKKKQSPISEKMGKTSLSPKYSTIPKIGDVVLLGTTQFGVIIRGVWEDYGEIPECSRSNGCVRGVFRNWPDAEKQLNNKQNGREQFDK